MIWQINSVGYIVRPPGATHFHKKLRIRDTALTMGILLALQCFGVA